MTSLYTPYKAIGYVTDGNAFSVNRLGNETFLTTSIGKSFQVYKVDHLRVCLVSKLANDKISCIETSGHETYTSVGCDIIVYYRNDIVRTYKNHTCRILGLLIVGNILLSYDIDNNIVITDIKDREVVDRFQLMTKSPITIINHPDTYINKFLIGYANGQLELWNIRTKKAIHTFTCHINHFKQHNKNDNNCSSVTSMQQSPAYDIMAIGFESGDILLINLKLDKVLFSFKQDGGAVTSLTFRTDNGAEKFPFMVSGTNDGRIHIWNLGTPSSSSNQNGESLERKLQSTVDDAHMSTVSKVQFLYGEPILISSSSDNSIKVWIFDNPDGTMRLLRSREGHTGHPLKIRYYGARTNSSMRENTQATNCELVSAGSDGTIRLFNTAIESQNKEMSQRRILDLLGMRRRNQKLPCAIGFDFSETRQRDWGNMVTIHRNHTNTYVWKYADKAITEMILHPPDVKIKSSFNDLASGDISKHATSVCVSLCGNFCIVGSKGGAVHKYNLQSGIHRGTYPQGLASSTDTSKLKRKSAIPGNVFHEHKLMSGQATKDNKEAKKHNTAASDKEEIGHSLEVTGLFIDLTNTVMVSCGLDGMIIFWDFQNHKPLHKVTHNNPQLLIQGFRDSSYVALAGQDRIIRVYDISTYKLSRRFDGHSREITDLAFTPDGRQLLSSSVDSTLRVWDLSTGRCLSWLLFDSPILTMAMSLSGEYLCVGQADKEGIYMYADRSLYETIHLWKEQSVPTPVSDSLVRIDEGSNAKQNQLEQDDEEQDESTSVETSVETAWKESSDQRGDGVITMSSSSRAYWTTLFNLETIKERNKADAAPIVPKEAPFFLPSTANSGPAAPLQTQQDKVSKDTQTDKKRKKQDEPEEEEPLGSAWDDGDGDEDDDKFSSGQSSRILSINEKKRLRHEKSKGVINTKSVDQKSMKSRCKLVGFMFQEYHNCNPKEKLSSEGRILNYLKSLTPPAVDIELRSLCRHDDDDDGILLLLCIIDWLQRNLVTGENFEILQAYLHRTLTIHSEIFLKVPSLIQALKALKDVHKTSCDRFRNIIQNNLCIVQLYSNIKPL